MSTPLLLDASGRPISVGPKLGAGGEGTVYAVSSMEVAKIYAAEPAAQRVAKLEALLRVASPDVRAIAAWPQQLLRERSGHVTGFTMPRIDGRVTIATAMNPGSRKATFPQATWGWLIHVGRNLAVAMEAVHSTGVVVGDVNDSNVLVGNDAVVRLIDVDSFQVRDGARIYTCDVGMPIYQPPELYGRSFPGLERTPNHDRFGLAVLIFQLVFMGRHPWAGIWKGADFAFDTGEVIARLPFVFGRDAAIAGHRPPANTVRLDWLPNAAAQLFEHAFAKDARPRPSGADWAAALAAFEGDLATCNASAMHRYARSRGACPWCDLERAGLFLFVTGGSTVSGGAAYLEIAAVQRRIDEIPPLVTVPVPVDPHAIRKEGEPLEPRLRLHRRLWLAGIVIAIVAASVAMARLGNHGNPIYAAYGALALCMLLARPHLRSVKRARRAAMLAADAAFDEAAQQWYAVADMHELALRKNELSNKLETYRALPAKYTAERARLEAEKPLYQQRAFLDRFLIADARIAGIGKKKRATLLSYGIETALDVRERLAATYIPKFGEGTRGILFAWVRLLEMRFRYDPSQPLDPRLVNDLLARENRERSDLERDLRGGPQALKALAEDRIARREAMRPDLVRLAESAAQARADYRVLRRI
jgi:DNA-binding helix-hairpin-helix protein with protein kinase domain